MFGRDFHYRIHVGHLTVEMDRHDRPSFLGDRSLDLRRVNIEGIRLDIHQYRLRAGSADGSSSREERERGSNYLIAAADAKRNQAAKQSIGTAGYANRLGAATILS